MRQSTVLMPDCLQTVACARHAAAQSVIWMLPREAKPALAAGGFCPVLRGLQRLHHYHHHQLH